MSGPTRRLFIGLMPGADVRDALVEYQQRWYWGGGAPTRSERLHLTVHFLGEIDATREWALHIRGHLKGRAPGRPKPARVPSGDRRTYSFAEGFYQLWIRRRLFAIAINIPRPSPSVTIAVPP